MKGKQGEGKREGVKLGGEGKGKEEVELLKENIWAFYNKKRSF